MLVVQRLVGVEFAVVDTRLDWGDGRGCVRWEKARCLRLTLGCIEASVAERSIGRGPQPCRWFRLAQENEVSDPRSAVCRLFWGREWDGEVNSRGADGAGVGVLAGLIMADWQPQAHPSVSRRRSRLPCPDVQPQPTYSNKVHATVHKSQACST